MKGRRTILLCGLASWLVVGGLSSQAQPAPPLVLMVNGATEESTRPFRESFLRGMRELGYVEGQTFRFRVLLVNPDFPAAPKIEARVQTTARSLCITIAVLHAPDRATLKQAIGPLARSRPDALLVGGDPLAVAYAREIIDWALALSMPVIDFWPQTAEHGALLSLQADIEDIFRRAAGYVDKILKGGYPGDLPVHQPTRYDLIVNLKTANALGLTIPQSLLLRADRVIR